MFALTADHGVTSFPEVAFGDALDGLSGWLHASAGDVPLAAVTPQVVSRYATERRLSAKEVDHLHGTLAGLFRWSRAARRSHVLG